MPSSPWHPASVYGPLTFCGAVCDDPDRAGALIELIGYMTLATLRQLKANNHLSAPANSSVPNIGLVVGLLVDYSWELATNYGPWDENAAWVFEAAKMVEGAGVKLLWAGKFEETLAALKKEEAFGQEMQKQWEIVNFGKQVSSPFLPPRFLCLAVMLGSPVLLGWFEAAC